MAEPSSDEPRERGDQQRDAFKESEGTNPPATPESDESIAEDIEEAFEPRR